MRFAARIPRIFKEAPITNKGAPANGRANKDKMPTKTKKSKKSKPSAKQLHGRVKELEKGHGKLTDIKDELRTISMEYSDIRSRIEATDVLIDHIVHQLDTERKMRLLTIVLSAAILAMLLVLLL